MTTLYLIRHGETGGNSEGRFQGIVNNPLNESGIGQAQNLGEYFSQKTIDAIYTSPLTRSVQTASIIAQMNQKKSLEPIVEQGLIEMNGGRLEGMKFADIGKNYPEVMKSIRGNLSALECPGGDSIRQVYDRISKTINHIIEENEGKTVVVVSHGIAIAAYIHFASRKPFEEMPNDLIENATAVCFHIEDGHISLDHVRQIIPDHAAVIG